MTLAAHQPQTEGPQPEVPDLMLVSDIPINDDTLVDYFHRAVHQPADTVLQLSADDIADFGHAKAHELTPIVLSTVLLRTAGETASHRDWTAQQLAKSALNSTLADTNVKIPKISASRAKLFTRLGKTRDNAVVTRADLTSQIGMYDTQIDDLQLAVSTAKNAYRQAADTAQPYSDIDQTVRSWEANYRSTYTETGKPLVSKIIAEINEPTVEFEHPSLEVLAQARHKLGDRAITPSRVLRMMLRDELTPDWQSQL